MKLWLTVKEAALLVGRHERNIYRWIEDDKLPSRVNAEGILEVEAAATRRVESQVKRGRPRGTVSKRR